MASPWYKASDRELFIILVVLPFIFFVWRLIELKGMAEWFSEYFSNSIYFPKSSKRKSHYGMARLKDKKGLYEEAISEYLKISMEFPDEIEPFRACFLIAFNRLNNPYRADELLKIALLHFKDDRDTQKILEDTYLQMHQEWKERKKSLRKK